MDVLVQQSMELPDPARKSTTRARRGRRALAVDRNGVPMS
jgi:hypothetical protein